MSVRDTGRGFESHAARRVFEPYPTTKPGGVGMGLTISRSIITHHGESLWVVANVDHGATFRFRLSLSEPGASERQDAPRARRVSIVDDHEEMRKSTARLVRAWGHKVALAEDGPVRSPSRRPSTPTPRFSIFR